MVSSGRRLQDPLDQVREREIHALTAPDRDSAGDKELEHLRDLAQPARHIQFDDRPALGPAVADAVATDATALRHRA